MKFEIEVASRQISKYVDILSKYNMTMYMHKNIRKKYLVEKV